MVNRVADANAYSEKMTGGLSGDYIQRYMSGKINPLLCAVMG